MAVPSLFDIALGTCIQLAARITDVGATPYHLVRPILKRLNAKQLAQLEENSPSVTPELDELWVLLLQKDFPDRPVHVGPKRRLVAGDQSAMPNKQLYGRYCDEREAFRATSAQRLRRMTEKIQEEKSKNSITPILAILREPLIRRRTPQTRWGAPPSRYASKSILGKAMKDVQHRLLMFGKGEPSRPKPVPRARPRPPVPAAPILAQPLGIYQQPPVGAPVGPMVAPGPIGSAGPSRVQSPGNSRPGSPGLPMGSPLHSPLGSPQPERKRRPPSIFLNPKKPRPRKEPSREQPRVPAREPARERAREPAREAHVEMSGPQKVQRSSIFRH